MKIIVLYFADLRDITNLEKETVLLTENCIKDLIHKLFDKYESFKDIIWDLEADNLKKGVTIAINHEILNKDDKISYRLSDGDTFALLLPMSGG